MSKALILEAYGGPDAFQWRDVDDAPLGPEDVRIRHTAVGLNFIDCYHRSGLYPLPLPLIVGTEAAGVVEDVGAGVSGLQEGDRVAYMNAAAGAYAERRVLPAALAVKIPDGISDDTAAAALLKGLTTQMLLRQVYNVQKGDAIVVHAAAGGVGLLLCQWGALLGAHVIGIVGSEEKAALAKAAGATDAIVRTSEDWVDAVRQLTDEKGAAVVYDSVGKATFMGSLDCLKPMGMMVPYGNASGAPDPVNVLELAKRGSLYLTRPTLFSYFSSRDALEAGTAELFDHLEAGRLTVDIRQRYPLQDAGRAHEDLEARKTTGATILEP